MLRSIFGVIAGVIVGGITVGIIEIPGILVHPLPPDFNPNDAAALRAHITSAPLLAMLFVAIAWFVGPLVGAWLAGIIARRAFLVHGMIVGLFFLAGDLMNILSFPHPAWLIAVGVVAPLVAGWLGANLARRTCGTKTAVRLPSDLRERNMAC
jgi:hypothetical protein